MEWEKASAELGVALEERLAGFSCQKKPMFGAPVYFVNDNMFTGVKGGVVFLRLSGSEQKSIMEESDEVQPFEPKPGFFMKEYVELTENKLFDQDFINKWLKTSYEYVLSLPPKVKKAKRINKTHK
jgi:TfoX/Sxy family transcriptional regulator of competence genes